MAAPNIIDTNTHKLYWSNIMSVSLAEYDRLREQLAAANAKAERANAKAERANAKAQKLKTRYNHQSSEESASDSETDSDRGPARKKARNNHSEIDSSDESETDSDYSADNNYDGYVSEEDTYESQGPLSETDHECVRDIVTVINASGLNSKCRFDIVEVVRKMVKKTHKAQNRRDEGHDTAIVRLAAGGRTQSRKTPIILIQCLIGRWNGMPSFVWTQFNNGRDDLFSKLCEMMQQIYEVDPEWYIEI